MSLRRSEKQLVGFFIFLLAFLAALVAVYLTRDDGLRNTWGESAEFSQLMTGQERFSTHETNLGRWIVVVDHQTGVQYLSEVGGRSVCPLLSADGSPLLVAEAVE